MKFDDFDRMMRQHELAFDQICPDDKWLVVRLDGRGFTRLTKEVLDFSRPFDDRFNSAMRTTCEHLMGAGIPSLLSYTQSDEISLLLDRTDVPFGGKVRKLLSILAGEASGVFSLAVGQPVSFDSRVCPLAEQDDVIDYFRWRAEDARRNALSALCYWMLREEGLDGNAADKTLSGLSSAKKTSLLKDRGVDFDKLPRWQTRGLFLRWQSEPHDGFDPITQSPVTVQRNRLTWVENTPIGEDVAALVSCVMQRDN